MSKRWEAFWEAFWEGFREAVYPFLGGEDLANSIGCACGVVVSVGMVLFVIALVRYVGYLLFA